MDDSGGGRVGPGLILNTQVAQAVAILGDRWAFLIIRDIYLGVRRFEDLRARSGVARGTLTSRLKSLVENGILHKVPYQSGPTRYEYRLTDKGLDLYPMVLMIWAWDHEWGPKTYLPTSLRHKSCGKSMVPVYRCKTCHGSVDPQEFDYSLGKDSDLAKKVPPRFQRRSKSSQERSGNFGSQHVTALDCIGDRWTSLVLAAGFFGLRRFDDIANGIGIATNILADRLSMLVKTGVFDRVPYQEQPLRYEYRLSEKARGFFPYTVALHEWADRWLIKPGKEPLLLRHNPCGSKFQGETVCSECGDVLVARDVTFEPSQ